MAALRPDTIKDGLHIASMADAANWPLLQNLGISHVLNVGIEAQQSAAEPRPFEEDGIIYMVVPLRDTPEQGKELLEN